MGIYTQTARRERTVRKRSWKQLDEDGDSKDGDGNRSTRPSPPRGETGPGSGQSTSTPKDGEPDSDGEEADSAGPRPSSQTQPAGSGSASASPHKPTKATATNPLTSSPLKKLTKSNSKSKFKILDTPCEAKPESATPKRSKSGRNKQAPATTPSQPSVPSQIPPPTNVVSEQPLRTTSSTHSSSSSLPQWPVTTIEASVLPQMQPPPADPRDSSQSKNITKAASQTAEKKDIPPEKVVQNGQTESVHTGSDPNPDVSAKNPSPPRVTESAPKQGETATGLGNLPEDPPAKSPSRGSTQDSFNKSDIESLYASPSPERTGIELEPIELDSDPDFDMMERMLFSHRGPASQSQSVKTEPTIQPLVLSGTRRPLKRQRSRPSLAESSQATPRASQLDGKPAKRSRVSGPHSPDSVVVLNDRRKHPEFWDLDGTVVLQVDDVLFRVMRSTLGKASPWFQRLFGEERDHPEIMAGCPVYTIEGDFSDLDFANLLRGLENGLEYALNPPHYLRIASIFRVASLLEFDTLRRWSLGCLEKQWPQDLPPPSKPSKFSGNIPWAEETLTIANRLDIPQLIKRAYWELCTRPEFGKIDAETNDEEIEEIMPTRSRLSRSVLVELTRVRERLLPEWTRITRSPPADVPCARATKTTPTPAPVIQPKPCSLDYASWYRVILEVEVDDMTIDDRRMDPISALEVMIVEIDWEKEGGFCPDCVRTWKTIWTKDREKIWRNLGDWLGLHVDTDS